MKTFLIADDSPEKILMLRHYIARAGFTGEVFIATTCEEAYALIKNADSISAAFIDYYIPYDNGPSIIRALHEKFPHAHIALVSSADSKKNTQEAKEAGAETALCTSYRSDIVERSILELLAEWMAGEESPS